MKVQQDHEVEAMPADMPGAEEVTMRIVIGPEDDSENMVMRHITVGAGGHTPHHTHDYEHVVRVLEGTGEVIDGKGTHHALTPGLNVFVPPNEKHQFLNTGSVPLAFTCTVLKAKL